MVGVPRVSGWAIGEGFGDWEASEFGATRAAQRDKPGISKSGNKSCVRISHRWGRRQRSVAVRHYLALIARPQILDEEWHSAEGAIGQVGGRNVSSMVEPADNDRVQWPVECFDPLDRSVG